MFGHRQRALARGVFLSPSASFSSGTVLGEGIMGRRLPFHVRIRQGEGRFLAQEVEGRKYAFIASQQTRTLHVLGMLVSRNGRVGSENGEVPEHWARAEKGEIGVVYRTGNDLAPQFFILSGISEHRGFIAQNVYQSAKCGYAVVEPMPEKEAGRIGAILLRLAHGRGLLEDWSASLALAVANLREG